MILMAIAVALVPAPVFSSPSRILEPKNLGLGFGILAMASGTGMFFGPYIAGFVRDKTGSYETSFIFLSILALLTTVTALILRVRTKRD
jgi:MFS-type transporter involved in bile tolerance (Atg22 family)